MNYFCVKIRPEQVWSCFTQPSLSTNQKTWIRLAHQSASCVLYLGAFIIQPAIQRKLWQIMRKLNTFFNYSRLKQVYLINLKSDLPIPVDERLRLPV